MKQFIVKASGEKEEFSREKIRNSYLRSGASKKDADAVSAFVSRKIKPRVNSEQIYKYSLEELSRRKPAVGARYSLKRAIMQLGPAGYLFERFVARILESYGYKTEVGKIVQGYCVEHEVDISARKGKEHFLIECKYHNTPGIYCDIKVALYTANRFADVVRASRELRGHTDEFHQAWLVTNTKCTSQAIKYARCSNLKILAWRYPTNNGLENIIESKQLYPVTILPSLPAFFANRLSENGVILAKDLLPYSKNDLANKFGIKINIADKIYKEIRAIF